MFQIGHCTLFNANMNKYGRKIIKKYFFQYSRGTVKDFPGFDARADAEALRKAMKGLGKSYGSCSVNEEGIISIVCVCVVLSLDLAAAYFYLPNG